MTRLLILGPVLALQFIPLCYSQESPDKLQIRPPFVLSQEMPSPNASAQDLEREADILREEKSYFDALDLYKAAIAKDPHSARLYNKAGMAELQAQHIHDSTRYFQRAIKLDSKFAAAHNNLGAAHYEEKKYGAAIKEYKKAIKIDPMDAAYYSNLGAAYFSKKQWVEANEAYARAVTLDPDIFERTSRHGIAAQMSSPEDRAHFQFVLAGLYAKGGNMDRALLCLRRAMEGGYKNIDEVYKDDEFANLRKDPRFAELMANPPKSLTN